MGILFDTDEPGSRGGRMDLYALLGLNPRATQTDIRAAYYAFAKAHHPDHAGDPARSEGAFKTMALAFAILRDPAKRKLYDRGDIDCRGAITRRGRKHFAQRRTCRAFAFSFSLGAAAVALVLVLLCVAGVIAPAGTSGARPGIKIAAATAGAPARAGQIASAPPVRAPVTSPAAAVLENAPAPPSTPQEAPRNEPPAQPPPTPNPEPGHERDASFASLGDDGTGPRSPAPGRKARDDVRELALAPRLRSRREWRTASHAGWRHSAALARSADSGGFSEPVDPAQEFPRHCKLTPACRADLAWCSC